MHWSGKLTGIELHALLVGDYPANSLARALPAAISTVWNASNHKARLERRRMSSNSNTTHREPDSIDAKPPMQLWLRWVLPTELPPIALDHALTIGREADSRMQLTGDGVSRRHAELFRQGPLFVIKDLGSTNGTFLNARRVQFAPIAPGAVLRVGNNLGIISEHRSAPSPFRSIATDLFGGHELSKALLPLERGATSNLSVVLIGETGTGKERVARALHEFSGRTGKFHALNCAALPKDLAEAELFGYRRGAFTGADRPALGHFRAADKGTLFLDEVCELPLPLQAKLLRVLEERTVTPLGETDAVALDLRVVTAAQKPLETFVVAQQFREDLMTRLSGLTVKIPPLRERRTDIAQLFSHFVRLYSGGRPQSVDVKLVESLCIADWPGNVRELEQLVRQLLAVHSLEPVLRRSLLPEKLIPQIDGSLPVMDTQPGGRADHDRARLATALRKTGNVKDAAALLGFSRHRAYRLLDGQKIEDFIAANSKLDAETPDEAE